MEITARDRPSATILPSYILSRPHTGTRQYSTWQYRQTEVQQTHRVTDSRTADKQTEVEQSNRTTDGTTANTYYSRTDSSAATVTGRGKNRSADNKHRYKQKCSQQTEVQIEVRITNIGTD